MAAVVKFQVCSAREMPGEGDVVVPAAELEAVDDEVLGSGMGDDELVVGSTVVDVEVLGSGVVDDELVVGPAVVV
eukprot:3931777-Rhodomonas_salina.1